MIHNKNIKLRELVLSNCSTRNVPSGMFFLDRRETFENTEKNQKCEYPYDTSKQFTNIID